MNALKVSCFFLIVMMLASCSIQHRRYRPGFHIEFTRSGKDEPAVQHTSPLDVEMNAAMDTVRLAARNSHTPAVSADSLHIPVVPSVTPSRELVISEPSIGTTRLERRLQRWAVENYAPILQSYPELARKLEPSAEQVTHGLNDEIPLAGKIFAWIGFGFIALSFSLFIYSFFYKPQGGSWGDLALLVSMIVYSWLALVFALIAQLIFWISGSITPWYQWPAITLGVLLTLAFVVGKIKG